jgi:hypothetical protein
MSSQTKTSSEPSLLLGCFLVAVAGFFIWFQSDSFKGSMPLINPHTQTADVSGAAVSPSVTTESPSAVAKTNATLSGSITDAGSEPLTARGFFYGKTTAYEIGTTVETDGIDTLGSFSKTVAGLVCGTTYHYAAYAAFNGINTNGADQSFTTNACPVYHLSSCPASKDLYLDMINEFDSRIAKVTVPADATTNVNRDSAFLRAWTTGLNLTGISIDGAHGGELFGYTLISPRHLITAWHLNTYGLVLGKSIPFQDSSGNRYTRTIVGFKQIGQSDIALAVLDSDLPSTVTYYPALANADLLVYLPPILPVMYSDQLGDYLIRKADTRGYYGLFIDPYPTGSPYYPFGLEADNGPSNALLPYAFPGDSGHAAFYLINNTMAIVNEMTTGGSGSMVGGYIPELNQAMSDLDKGFPDLGNDYQMTTVDMSCFSPYVAPPDISTTIQPQSFNVDQFAATSTAVGTVAYNRPVGNNASTTMFFINGNIGQAFAIDINGRITVAKSSVIDYQKNPTFNLEIFLTEDWPAPDNHTNVVHGSVTVHVSDTLVQTSDTTAPVITLPVNRAPIANAGPDQTVTSSSTVNLSASASSDPDGDTLTYSWSKVSGPGTVTFSNPSSTSTVAAFSQTGTYVIRITVSDGTLSSFDQTNVTVNSVATVSYAITSSAGSNGSISPSGTVTVNRGSSQTFIVTPNSGYQVGSVVVDGVNVSLTGNAYTFTNVTANRTISVNFNRVSDTTPPFITSVTLSNVTTNSAVISWITNETASTQVKYGFTTAYSNTTSLNGSMVTSHTVNLTNLSSNTLYHYAVISKDAAGNTSTSGDATFSTPPVTQSPTPVPAYVPAPTYVPAPAYNPDYISPYYPNTTPAKSSNGSLNELPIPTSTPDFGTWTSPPSIAEFIWSSITDRIYSLSSSIQYFFEQVIKGVENTL